MVGFGTGIAGWFTLGTPREWLGLIAGAIGFRWTPPAHQVHTEGATSIGGAHLAQANRPTYGYLQLTPSLSLDDLRCQAWRGMRTEPCPDAATLDEAVRKAFELAKPSGVVLLAPACASFDMFRDYAERGRKFKEEVARMARQTQG